MPEAPPPLLALLDVGAALLRRTASGRVLLARYANVVRADLLSDRVRAAVRQELEDAYAAAVEPLDPKAVQKAARRLDKVSEEPIAVTPTAQVHAAELAGEPVAVKVARPGLAATIRGELSLLDLLAGPIRVVFGALDIAGVLGEVRETVMDELDLEHEGETQAQVRRALRRLDEVTVPAVHLDECSAGLLVTERLEGPTLAEARADDPARVARLLVRAHLAAWSGAGLVLTDARPSHVILRSDGSIGLLGTGLARPVARGRAGIAVRAFAGLASQDPAGFVAAVADLGVWPEADAAAAHALLREVLGEFATGPARLDGPALAEMAGRASRRGAGLLELAARVNLEPADLAALRMLAQLTTTLARLEVTEDWTALAARACAVPGQP